MLLPLPRRRKSRPRRTTEGQGLSKRKDEQKGTEAGVEAGSWSTPLQADVGKAACPGHSVSAAPASAEAESLFMSKFGNLSVGGGGGRDRTGVEAGSVSGEVDDVFKSMDTECKVCMQKNKVRSQVNGDDDVGFIQRIQRILRKEALLSPCLGSIKT